MWEVRYLGGFCRIYGQEFNEQWKTVGQNIYMKVRNAPNWEIKNLNESNEEVVEEEPTEEEVEVVDEVIDLSTLSKKELQALCDEQGIQYKSLDTKATLLSLLSDEEE